ncbi:MBL fold metallo-hydrolase RNA specificity domain-containing protein [Daejeonella sp.]|uniref:MBL fold metallo-hydrolase RNA specificity domain-containing protein n=1 Tax=Daejeonella sp. TaxID=2805397 RepID=UPI003983007B
MDAVILQSLGGAETVTGSKHFLTTPSLNVLIDCGLFQGIKSLREQNWQKLPIPVGDIDVLILTHAHLDHCGYIPLLVKKGFRGKIYSSEPTRDLARLIMLDSAKIQEEDAARANRFRYSKHSTALPLYTVKDAENSLELFKAVSFNELITLNEHISFMIKPSGHILGAGSVSMMCYGHTIVFSGDIGRLSSQLLESPDYFTTADYVIMESTYGDKLHSTEDPAEQLSDIINETVKLKGNILIPTFAVGRAQELMFMITKLKKEKKIPSQIPVFLDSPMAAEATKISDKYAGFFKVDKQDWLSIKEGVTINSDFQQTEEIIQRKGSKIILAASGMLTGGRVLEYLKHYVSDQKNVVLLMGYQAEGTRGRALQNRNHELKIHGAYYPVHVRVREITGLSAHADQSELLHWLSKFVNRPQQVILVHGEHNALETLRVKIKDTFNIPVKIMKPNQQNVLFFCEPV